MALTSPRRPTRFRAQAWARGAARWLARAGIAPNAISVAGVAAAGIASMALLATSPVLRSAVGFAATPDPASAGAVAAVGYGLALAFIALRMVAGLLDGMVAVEFERADALGAVFNELPERLSDLLIFAALGAACTPLPWVGLCFGLLVGWLALGTAYVRLLGETCGAHPGFGGVGSKTGRMALVAVGLACAAALALAGHDASLALAVTLLASAVATAATFACRTIRIARRLAERRSPAP